MKEAGYCGDTRISWVSYVKWLDMTGFFHLISDGRLLQNYLTDGTKT